MRLWSSFSPSLSALVPFVQHMKFLFLATQALIRSFSSSLYHHPSSAVVLSSFALLLLASVINFPALSSVLCGWLKLCLLRTSVLLLWLYWYIYIYIYLYITGHISNIVLHPQYHYCLFVMALNAPWYHSSSQSIKATYLSPALPPSSVSNFKVPERSCFSLQLHRC